MESAHNPFIVEYFFEIIFRIDGANLVSKLCHQYEEKILARNSAYSSEFRRSGDHARLAAAGTDLAQ
jgi:hypothetical protein